MILEKDSNELSVGRELIIHKALLFLFEPEISVACFILHVHSDRLCFWLCIWWTGELFLLFMS